MLSKQTAFYASVFFLLLAIAFFTWVWTQPSPDLAPVGSKLLSEGKVQAFVQQPSAPALASSPSPSPTPSVSAG